MRAMELLNPEGSVESGAGEDELLPEPDGEKLATAQEETPALGGDLLVEADAEAESEIETGGRAPENGAASPEADEPLDPGLVQLFVEAKNEVQESVLASELPDIPIQDLLSELVSLSRCLGIEPPAPAEPANEGASTEGERPPDLQAARPPLVGSRRHALHGLLLSLTLVTAIASVLVGADRIVGSRQSQDPKPPAVVTTTHPGVVVRQVHPGQATLEPAPGATPTSVPTRQPAYVIYTVQRGDTLTSIAAAFGISLDHILWTNPDVIDDPNLLLVGDNLLIPSVAGMIYYVKPGDVLSVLGRLLPAQEPDDSGPPPRQPNHPD